MDLVKRVLTFLTFFVCCGALAFLTASYSTNYWVVVKPVREVFDVSNISTPVNVEEEGTGKFRGEISFGLFKGEKRLNHGFGLRPNPISVRTEMSTNPQLMNFGLWLFTILSLALALLFGVVSAVFAVINTVMTPVEVITGVVGLYLWNGIAALFSLAAILSWVAQFHLKLNVNVMSKDEQKSQWVSEGYAEFGFSFWFVAVALVLFVGNVGLVSLALKQPWESRQPKRTPEKNPEGVIMLY